MDAAFFSLQTYSDTRVFAQAFYIGAVRVCYSVSAIPSAAQLHPPDLPADDFCEVGDEFDFAGGIGLWASSP
jgi:hypothetical protein